MKQLDLLLINPGNIRHNYVTEHLGIASLVSYIKSQGYSVDSLDMSIEKLSPQYALPRILHQKPRMIGFSLLEDSKHKGMDLIKALRRAGYVGHIVVGGYFPTFSSRELLQDVREIDYVVRGEGEITLAELMESLIGARSITLNHILGLSYRENEEIKENPARPLIQNLDLLPAPDRKYSGEILKRGSRLRIYGTRGCWGNCSFCDIVGLYGSSPGKAWRSRSIKSLVDEIQDLKEKYQTDYFVFNDDQFLLRGKKADDRINEFASEIKRRQLDIKFEMMCRADTIKREGMKKLKSVGLQSVFLGLESFDEKQLERFRKRISVRQNLKALITLYQLKIDVVASVILADAYTTIREIVKQFIMLFELKRRYFNSPNCQISINQRIEVYRGSAIYYEYRKKGLLTTDHYMGDYDYRLKFWTGFRLKIFDLEAWLGRVLLRPFDTMKSAAASVLWSIKQFRNVFSTTN